MISSISLEHLAVAQEIAIHGPPYSGRFVSELHPKMISPPAAPFSVICDDQGYIGHIRLVNSERKEVNALSLNFIKDISLFGEGLLFHGDMFVQEHSHLGDVAFEYANNKERPLRSKNLSFRSLRGISVIAPGYKIYGHWIVDFLPRLLLAKNILGSDLEGRIIPLPNDTPGWAIKLIVDFCGIPESSLLYYNIISDILEFSDLAVPAYAHASYNFHPQLLRLMNIRTNATGKRKLCISRRGYEKQTFGVMKRMENRGIFEEAAKRHGYEIICPEDFSFKEQLDIFGAASCVVGEYGSALHSMLFAPKGAVVGMIRCPNDVQLRISALCRQKTVLAVPEREWLDESGAVGYYISPKAIEELFEKVQNFSVN